MDTAKLKQMIKDSDNIVFFGGAGVSTASNIPDFRSASGLYNEKTNARYTPEQILSHTFFICHTDEFYDFYKEKMVYKDAKPNDAHIALAKLEEMGKLKAVVTQNIDGLHQMAGSKNVLELHGSIYRNRCTKCNKFFDLDYVLNSKGVPECDECRGTVKPEVVLYEEGLDQTVIEASVNYIANADMLIVGGTSLSVYPAAGLVTYYKGDKLVLINKSKTQYDHRADLAIDGDIAKVLREAVLED